MQGNAAGGLGPGGVRMLGKAAKHLLGAPAQPGTSSSNTACTFVSAQLSTCLKVMESVFWLIPELHAALGVSSWSWRASRVPAGLPVMHVGGRRYMPACPWATAGSEAASAVLHAHVTTQEGALHLSAFAAAAADDAEGPQRHGRSRDPGLLILLSRREPKNDALYRLACLLQRDEGAVVRLQQLRVVEPRWENWTLDVLRRGQGDVHAHWPCTPGIAC